MEKVQINNTPGSEDWKEHWRGVDWGPDPHNKI